MDRSSSEGKKFLSDVNGAIKGIRESSESGRNFAHSGGLRLNYVLKNEEKYYDLYSALNAILWNMGYLFDKSYSFWDPSGGKKPGKELEEWARKNF